MLAQHQPSCTPPSKAAAGVDWSRPAASLATLPVVAAAKAIAPALDALHAGCAAQWSGSKASCGTPMASARGYSMTLSMPSTGCTLGGCSMPSTGSSLCSTMNVPISEAEAPVFDRIVLVDCGAPVPEKEAPAPEREAPQLAEEPDLSPTTHASHREDSRDDAMLIFDWDDTLLPTSALASSLPGFPTASPSGAVAEELRRHAAGVWSLLRAARQVARVAIVTSSSSGWVQESAARYLLDLDFQALCLELDIQVHYAGSLEESGASDSVILKRDAMVQALTSLPAGADEEAGMARLNAISVGDSAVTARALRELLGSWGASGLLAFAPLCKTVKLMPSPTVAALGDELDRLSVWLEHMAISDSEFDITVSQPAEVTAKALALFSA